MNIVLLEPAEIDGCRAVLGGRRAKHIATVHRAAEGRQLRVGVIGGNVGTAEVVSVSPERVELDVRITDAPPPAVECTLALALPRPRVLHRVLGSAATFGIKRILLFGSRRVEKSYWASPVVSDEQIRERLLEGLEQGGDTIVPVVEKHRLFRPFVEDRLAGLARGTLALVADATGERPCPRADGSAVTLVVGPEGGLIEHELALLGEAGLEPVTLGARPLRVEHAFAMLLGRLF